METTLILNDEQIKAVKDEIEIYETKIKKRRYTSINLLGTSYDLHSNEIPTRNRTVACAVMRFYGVK